MRNIPLKGLMRNSPLHNNGVPNSRHHQQAKNIAKDINPVIQTGRFLANSSKSTDEALKKEAKTQLKTGRRKNYGPKY